MIQSYSLETIAKMWKRYFRVGDLKEISDQEPANKTALQDYISSRAGFCDRNLPYMVQDLVDLY